MLSLVCALLGLVSWVRAQDPVEAIFGDPDQEREELQALRRTIPGEPGQEQQLGLQRKVHENFIIAEKVPTRTFSWLKVPTCDSTFNMLLRHYAKLAMVSRRNIGMLTQKY